MHTLNYLVLRVQFASTAFNGSESSGEIFIAVNITGGIPTVTVSVNVNFVISTATGLLICHNWCGI